MGAKEAFLRVMSLLFEKKFHYEFRKSFVFFVPHKSWGRHLDINIWAKWIYFSVCTKWHTVVEISNFLKTETSSHSYNMTKTILTIFKVIDFDILQVEVEVNNGIEFYKWRIRTIKTLKERKSCGTLKLCACVPWDWDAKMHCVSLRRHCRPSVFFQLSNK